MADINPNPIQFGLRSITTEQFALIESAYKEGVDIGIQTNLRFAKRNENKMVGIFTKIEFMQDEIPFIILDMGCHIQIEPKSWENIYNSEKNSITLPMGFVTHLTSLVVGTARGYLHSKLEKNLVLNKLFIPLLDITNVVNTDIEIINE